jgi:hypothetical protein
MHIFPFLNKQKRNICLMLPKLIRNPIHLFTHPFLDNPSIILLANLYTGMTPSFAPLRRVHPPSLRCGGHALLHYVAEGTLG